MVSRKGNRIQLKIRIKIGKRTMNNKNPIIVSKKKLNRGRCSFSNYNDNKGSRVILLVLELLHSPSKAIWGVLNKVVKRSTRVWGLSDIFRFSDITSRPREKPTLVYDTLPNILVFFLLFCCLDGLHLSSYLQVFQSLYQFLRDWSKCTNYNWYQSHLHVPLVFNSLDRSLYLSLFPPF